MTKQAAPPRGFTRAIDVRVPAAHVYDALTTLEGLRGWWTPRVLGAPTPPGTLRFEFDGVDEHIDMRVEIAERPSHVQWTCLTHSALPEWRATTVDFVLAPHAGNGCRLDFRHVGLTPALDCYEDCRAGWDHFLRSLVTFAEVGTGSPFGA